MDENSNTIIGKNINLVSPNMPVALVVGAAGFIGSFLVDKLLEKDIQVIGIDNFSTGKKENLEKAIRDKNFHFIEQSAQNLNLDIPRVDYVLISTTGEWDIAQLLKSLKDEKSRYLLISSIELYEKTATDEHLRWLEQTEIKLAKYVSENKLNARILRLGAVYGPRMHFKLSDPLIKLIQEAILGNLQKGVSLQFSSRALFIEDACELAIKSMLAGATAQKIFDGCLPAPIKIEEAKQILLDPVWYEERGFHPSELPPWPTPNLEKTIKFLNWRPKTSLVKALKQTLSYLKEKEVDVDKVVVEDKKEDRSLDEKTKMQLEALKIQHQEKFAQKQKSEKTRIKSLASKIPTSKVYSAILMLLITYAIIWPIFTLGWGVLTFKYQLQEAEKNLGKGEFDKSLSNMAQANWGVKQSKQILDSFEPLRKIGFLEDEFSTADGLLKLADLTTEGTKSAILGIQSLYKAMKAVTGELNEDSSNYFTDANLYLVSADENLSKARASLQDEQFKFRIPKLLKNRLENLENRLSQLHKIVQQARATSMLLPKVVGLDEGKSYLFLLQNNNELRPGGGFIGSFAKVDFESGKLKKLAVNDIYAIDGMLKTKVEPPKEIREDLAQKDWFLRDSNWEPDFPTNARQAEWFFTKETGEKVEGVVALDVTAMEYLLEVIGPLKLFDYEETITSENLFEKAVLYAEASFFPGTQAKRSFLTSLTNELFNKIFFLPKQNWPGIVSALGRSLEERHISVYLDDPRLFSYVVAQNWAGLLPRVPDEKDPQSNVLTDLLVPLEANLGANKSNYYLDRSYKLDTSIGKEGEIRHRLRITYINRSPDEVWPAGKYKNRFRVYLPFGARLIRLLWGEANITKDATAFVDYGRSGYSMLLELLPKEQKSLIIDYEIPDRLKFVGSQAKYRIDVIKQAGTLKDPFEWTLRYPLNYRVTYGDKILSAEGVANPQELTIATDLSKDRSFEVTFKK